MKQVWEYELQLADEFILRLPIGAVPLSVGEQEVRVMLWAIVDPDEKTLVTRRFRIAGIGHPITVPMDSWKFIGTVQCRNGLVWHIWEIA